MASKSLHSKLNEIDYSLDRSKEDIIEEISVCARECGYRISEINLDKPWGGYLKFDYDDADQFVDEFFPEIDSSESRLGDEDASLSPKILLVSPGERLSWQYHHRRAERWKFLTSGKYFASQTDEPGEVQLAAAGTSLQLECGERHRLVGVTSAYVVVAEIWQHVDPGQMSDEDDIVRLSDDYAR